MSSLAVIAASNSCRRRGVEIEHGERATAGLTRLNDMRRDVDPVPAEQRPDTADNAGSIGVFEHAAPPRADGAPTGRLLMLTIRGVAPRNAPATESVFPSAARREFEQVGVIARAHSNAIRSPLRPNVSANAGALTSIDVFATGQLEKALENRARDRGGIDLVDFSTVVDVQVVHPFRRDLGEEAPQLLAETQMWPNDRKRLGVEVRQIDRVADGAFEKGRADGLGDFDPDTFLGLDRGSAQDVA